MTGKSGGCHWEQHRRSPDAPVRTLLGMVEADRKAALALIDLAAS